MSSETSTRFYDVLTWLEVHKKQLLIGGIAAALLILGVAAQRWWKRERETAASMALVTLRAGDAAGKNQEPTAQDFLKLAGEYSATAAGERAQLLGAGRLFAGNKYAEAQAEFERFLKERPESAWTGQAMYGAAAALDAANRFDEALARYQQVIAAYGTEPIADQARIAMAAIHEARKQPELALKLYDEALRSKPGSWTLVAGRLREKLLQAHPALAPTNTVTTVVSNQIITITQTSAPPSTSTGRPPDKAPAIRVEPKGSP